MSATISNPTTFAGCIAMAFAVQMGLALIGSSTAAAEPVTTRVAEASSSQVQPTLAVETSDDLANCSRARRRLWVDGEGWIVRRITTCR